MGYVALRLRIVYLSAHLQRTQTQYDRLSVRSLFHITLSPYDTEFLSKTVILSGIEGTFGRAK